MEFDVSGNPEYDSRNFPNLNPIPEPFPRQPDQTEHVDEKFKIPQVHPRIKFLRKLYFLLFLQLLVCGICTITVYFVKELQEDLNQTPTYLLMIPLFLVFVMLMLIFFQRKFVSKIPLNILAFIVFTCFLAFSFAWITALDSTLLILMFLISACSIAFSLMIYTLTTKTELTYQGACLFVLGAIFIVFQIFILFTQANINYLICGLILNIVWGFYLIYDTQTSVSGSNYDWAKDDPYSGAVLIYIDIFILVLRLCELVRQLIIRERN